MGKLRTTAWQKLPISLTELCIDTTLRCGQSFRWRKSADDEWSCALHGRIISLRQDATHLHYRATFPSATTAPLTPPPSSPPSLASASTSASASPSPDSKHIPVPSTPVDDTEALLRAYFNLGPDLAALYAQWSAADANFRRKAPRFAGVRILRQDAWEALVGFICSSNNNIVRIAQMVHKLCVHYGRLVGHVGGVAYHAFPGPAALTGPGVEARLRQLGFGYRAKYLWQTAVMVVERGGEAWLEGLRNRGEGEQMEGGRVGYRGAHEKLLELQGVGPKVADCVCLMGLGWGEAVPVDTHVWQIAQRDYKFGKGKHSSLTKATYDAVGNKFRSLWGMEAGWAHSVLFTADLRAFSERLKAKVEEIEEKTKVVRIKVEETKVVGVKVEEKNEVEVIEEVKKEVVLDTRVKKEVVLNKRVKRESEHDERQVLGVQEDMMSRVKRRRRR